MTDSLMRERSGTCSRWGFCQSWAKKLDRIQRKMLSIMWQVMVADFWPFKGIIKDYTLCLNKKLLNMK